MIDLKRLEEVLNPVMWCGWPHPALQLLHDVGRAVLDAPTERRSHPCPNHSEGITCGECEAARGKVWETGVWVRMEGDTDGP